MLLFVDLGIKSSFSTLESKEFKNMIAAFNREAKLPCIKTVKAKITQLDHDIREACKVLIKGESVTITTAVSYTHLTLPTILLV